MKKINILFFLLILFIGEISATEDFSDLKTSAISDSLKDNAWGVIRFSKTEFEYKSATSGIERNNIAITVLDKKGKDLADFHYSGDRFRELKNFTGKLYDSNGTLLRKFKMSDVFTTGWSDCLATDAKHYIFNCETPSFPFTIVYEYEVNWKDGIQIFPSFYPQDNYNLSVENASYRLILPENVEFKSKAINMANEPKKSMSKENAVYEWEVHNLRAVENESFDPDIETYVPILYISPKHFIFDGVSGEITDWGTMGKWVYDLTKDRDVLGDDVRNKIIDMTKDAKSDREKVKILYNYLGKSTRYVSIQLGIGGYQPMLASEVCKTGFGDCKALSNYMRTMLSIIGIPSNYTTIRLDKSDKTLYPDYANFVQMNHAILQVPLPNDTLWLECTNPRVPFGFVHNGISGHQALVSTENGGKIYRLPDYQDSLNMDKNNARIEIGDDGSAKVSMQKTCKMKIYDDYSGFTLISHSEQADNLRKDITLPNVSMGSIQVTEDKSPLPSMDINYSWTTSDYGNKTGNRLFIPVNPFRPTYEWMKKSKRVHDMEISRGSNDLDSIYIVLPEGYEIETMPAPCVVKTSFGTLQSSVEKKDKGILIKQDVFIPAGKYKVSAYPDFTAFFDQISSAYEEQIILRKQTN